MTNAPFLEILNRVRVIDSMSDAVYSIWVISWKAHYKTRTRITAVGHRAIRKSDCVGSAWDEGSETGASQCQ